MLGPQQHHRIRGTPAEIREIVADGETEIGEKWCKMTLTNSLFEDIEKETNKKIM